MFSDLHVINVVRLLHLNTGSQNIKGTQILIRYLTLARSEPTSDLVKPLISEPVNGWMDLSMLNRWLIMTLSSGYHGYMSRIGIPSQITVDCKSDHCLPFSYNRKCLAVRLFKCVLTNVKCKVS